ncbi:MAG: hypothetical protein WAO08_10790 [Hyphomicrobiaceae bacterium]
MTTAPTVTRLAIALISVVNASAALTLPKAISGASPAGLLAAAAGGRNGTELRMQRPPRLPRRDPASREWPDATARQAGGEA